MGETVETGEALHTEPSLRSPSVCKARRQPRGIDSQPPESQSVGTSPAPRVAAVARRSAISRVPRRVPVSCQQCLEQHPLGVGSLPCVADNRDDFPESVKRTLYDRVGLVLEANATSSPRDPTSRWRRRRASGPRHHSRGSQRSRYLAANLCDSRRSFDNGIWLRRSRRGVGADDSSVLTQQASPLETEAGTSRERMLLRCRSSQRPRSYAQSRRLGPDVVRRTRRTAPGR